MAILTLRITYTYTVRWRHVAQTFQDGCAEHHSLCRIRDIVS